MATTTPMTELWRGGVNAWECDEMGHMNTRFYVARAQDALVVLFSLAGLPRQFDAHHAADVTLDEIHTRFHREARAATPLHMTGGFSVVAPQRAEVVLLLWHSLDGALAATFRVTLCHHGQGWSDLPRGAVSLMVEAPPEAWTRSTSTGQISGATGDLSRHARISMGAISATECDAAGRMLPQKFTGGVADGVKQLTAPLRDIVVHHADPKPTSIGGAVLETRTVQFEWPRAGAAFEVRSALCHADARTMTLEHWLVDPVTGRKLGYSEAVAIVFDIDRRKIVPISEAAQAELSRHIVHP